MKIGVTLFRFGIFGLLFAGEVLFANPLKALLIQNHSLMATYILLYGFPVLVGFSMLSMTEEGFRNPPIPIARLLNALSALTLFWMMLWCVLWFNSPGSNQANPFVKYIDYLGPIGPLMGIVLYGWGWKAIKLPQRTARFIFTIGWNMSFVNFINLQIDPSMAHLKGPIVGGLLVMGGAYMILQEI